jgi:pimeloyl-ACP methyl ester carboxylesterase
MLEHPTSDGSDSTESRVCVFGDWEHLVGVFQPGDQRPSRCDSLSTGSLREPGRTAVLMLTPGMLHSAGPFRLHRELANALSKHGIPSLRFDLSGIGESLAIGADGSSLERARSEICQAIDFLEREYGIRKVVCFGLCSGADDALHAALHEERIAGVFALDGCGYRTRAYYWHRLRGHYLPKLLSGRKWSNRLAKIAGLGPSTPRSLQLGDDIREFPTRTEAAEQISRIRARGTALHFHYTGGVAEYYNYEMQFADMFADILGEDCRELRQTKDGLISWFYQPESDHVGFLCEHRETIVDQAVRRMLVMASRVVMESPTESICENKVSEGGECSTAESPLADDNVINPIAGLPLSPTSAAGATDSPPA